MAQRVEGMEHEIILPGAPKSVTRLYIRIMVGVAQLVESRIVIPVVVGSSPIVHPIHLREQGS
jgi:hypothetical protein